MPKPLVAVVLLLLAGALAWFAFGGGTDAAPPPSAPAPGVAADKPPAERADLVQGGAVGRAPAAAPADRTAVVAPAAGNGAGSGDGKVRVRGRLVDGKQAPRAGATLAVASFRSPEGVDIDLPMPLARVADDQKAKVKTAADGGFEFALGKDQYAFLELPDGLVYAAEQPSIQGRKGDQDLGVLVAIAEARVSGVVRDERGQGVPGVKVAASIGSIGFGESSSATTDAEGRFTVGMLRAGSWMVRTASGKYLPATAEVKLVAEERREGLELVVKQGLAISGQVLDDRGLPVAGLKVGSKRKEARGGIDIERFTADETTTTDQGGWFTLAGLEGERVAVRAFGSGHTTAVASDVAIGTGDLVLRVDRTAVIEGVLLGSDGAPLAGSRVTAEAEVGRVTQEAHAGGRMGLEHLPLLQGNARAVTAADGTFRLENVHPGTVLVAATGASHRPASQAGVMVTPAQIVRGVRLVAERGAVAKVKVLDEQGKPVAGAKVEVRRPPAQPPGDGLRMVSRRVSVEANDAGSDVEVHDGDEPLATGVSDAEGLATLAGLPSGAVEVGSTHDAFAAAVPQPATLPKSGIVEVALQLRTPGFADVHVFGTDGSPAPGVAFRVRGPRGDRSGPTPGTSDAAGAARIGPLAPGDYDAELTRAPGGTRIGGAMFVLGDSEGEAIGGTRQTFRVVAGETVRVDLRRPLLTRLAGTVAGVDGPVAECAIELRKVQEGQPAMPNLPGLGGGRSTSSDAAGAFHFDDVEAGDYVLEFGRPEQVAKAKQAVHVAGDQADQRVDLALRTGKLRVQVVDQVDGKPVVGAEITLQEPAAEGAGQRTQRVMMMTISTTEDGPGGGETMMTVGDQRARTDAAGIAELDQVPAGTWDVRIEDQGHAPRTVPKQVVVEQQLTDCGRVELSAAGRIRGKVTTADGKPARMALVRRRGGGGDPAQPQPAMGGSFTMDALVPGKYVLWAQPLTMGPGGGGPGAAGPEVEVEVKAGETATVELQLPK